MAQNTEKTYLRRQCGVLYSHHTGRAAENSETGKVNGMREKIVVMGGSFNPPTIAHQRLMLGAVETLGAARGIFVPSSHAYVSAKMRRDKHRNEVLPEEARLRMLLAMAADDPRLEVEDCEFHRAERSYTYESMGAVQEKYPEAELYFVAGGDKTAVISRWHRIREFLERFRIVLVRREDYEPEAELRQNPFLSGHLDRFSMIEAPAGLDGVSSSAVREKLREGLPGAEAMLHPAVWAILQEYAGAYRMKIEMFRGEYQFLSNFYEAPVEYRGLRYGSNEAAFQAQKCLTEEERREFTLLRPSDSKKRGSSVQLRPDWEEVKAGIMEELVRAKFTQNEELGRLLLATGKSELIEGNSWNDTFWGVDLKTGEGRNELGKALMKVRAELAARQV